MGIDIRQDFILYRERYATILNIVQGEICDNLHFLRGEIYVTILIIMWVEIFGIIQ